MMWTRAHTIHTIQTLIREFHKIYGVMEWAELFISIKMGVQSLLRVSYWCVDNFLITYFQDL